MKHFGQPVESRIGIAPPEALDQRTGCIVVIIPRAVVDDGLFLDALGGGLKRDPDTSVRSERRRSRRNLQSIEALAGIPVADRGKMQRRILL